MARNHSCSFSCTFKHFCTLFKIGATFTILIIKMSNEWSVQMCVEASAVSWKSDFQWKTIDGLFISLFCHELKPQVASLISDSSKPITVIWDQYLEYLNILISKYSSFSSSLLKLWRDFCLPTSSKQTAAWPFFRSAVLSIPKLVSATTQHQSDSKYPTKANHVMPNTAVKTWNTSTCTKIIKIQQVDSAMVEDQFSKGQRATRR